MKNLFVLASVYGVQLKAEEVTKLGTEISEDVFKENFKIPAWVEKGYRKHKTYKVEELLTVAGEVSVAVKNEIIRNEIAHLEVMKEKAIGYKKKGRAEEIQTKIQDLEVLVGLDETTPAPAPVKAKEEKVKKETETETVTAESFTREQLDASAMNKKSRKYFILLAQHQTTEEMLAERPELEKGEVYIPVKEYFELIRIAKEYFAPQVEQAVKTLKNKL